MSKWLYLSHFLDSNAPIYGGGSETFRSVPLKSIKNGDSCNTSQWFLSNHIGTHIDFPRHFITNGRTAKDYSAAFWIFHCVHMIDISWITPSQVINSNILNIDSIPHNTDIFLIKTGLSAFRGEVSYWNSSPVFMPDLADALRNRCQDLRVVGIDTISLSSWSNRELGREAHKAFLDYGKPILPLEDMNFSPVGSDTLFKQLIVSPLIVSDADASPCTVFCEIEE